jgi:hypothetical protein
MAINENTVKQIKEWIKCDNEIRILQKELNIRKREKKIFEGDILTAMKSNQIDCFQVKDGGSIHYKKQFIKKPISQTFLLKLLVEYYNGDEEKASVLQQFLKNNREEVVKENILLKTNNKE